MLDERGPCVDDAGENIRIGRLEEEREDEMYECAAFGFESCGVDKRMVARTRCQVWVCRVLKLNAMSYVAWYELKLTLGSDTPRVWT